MSPALVGLLLFDLAVALFLVAGFPCYRGRPVVLAVTLACLAAAVALAHLAHAWDHPWLAAWAPALQAGCWVVYGLAFVASAFHHPRPPCPGEGSDEDASP